MLIHRLFTCIHRMFTCRDIFAQTCKRVLRDGTGTLPTYIYICIYIIYIYILYIYICIYYIYIIYIYIILYIYYIYIVLYTYIIYILCIYIYTYYIYIYKYDRGDLNIIWRFPRMVLLPVIIHFSWDFPL